MEKAPAAAYTEKMRSHLIIRYDFVWRDAALDGSFQSVFILPALAYLDSIRDNERQHAHLNGGPHASLTKRSLPIKSFGCPNVVRIFCDKS